MRSGRVTQRLSLGLALAAASAALAQDLGYTYVGGGYTHATYEAIAVDADTFGFEASLAAAGNLHLWAQGVTIGGETGGIGFDARTGGVGAGLHLLLTPRASWYVRGGYAYGNVEVSTRFVSVAEDDTGYAVATGVRGMVSENIELHGQLSHVDVTGGETTVTLDARYYVSRRVSVGLRASRADDVRAYGLHAALHF